MPQTLGLSHQECGANSSQSMTALVSANSTAAFRKRLAPAMQQKQQTFEISQDPAMENTADPGLRECRNENDPAGSQRW